MKLLVIGSGGREHAIAWKLAQSPKVQKVFVAPGNGGTARENGLENVALSEVPELVAFARKEGIYLTVVGPEAALAAGVVDAFREAGLKIFGPTRAAAQLESSRTSPRRSWCAITSPPRCIARSRARSSPRRSWRSAAHRSSLRPTGSPPERAWWWRPASRRRRPRSSA